MLYTFLYISCKESSNTSRCERPVNSALRLDQNESFARGTVTLQRQYSKYFNRLNQVN